MEAYIIYCPQYKTSLDNMLKVVQTCRDHNIVPMPHTGVSGFDAPGIIERANFKLRSDLGSYRNRLIRSPGVQGCFLSHFTLWQKCVELDKPIFILEHDGLIIRTPPTDLDWVDVLALDGNRSKPMQEDAPIVVGDFVHPMYPDTISIAGAYAYAIKPHAAQKLINETITNGINTADDMISKSIVTLEQTNPAIATLDTSYTSSLTDHDWIK